MLGLGISLDLVRMQDMGPCVPVESKIYIMTQNGLHIITQDGKWLKKAA